MSEAEAGFRSTYFSATASPLYSCASGSGPRVTGRSDFILARPFALGIPCPQEGCDGELVEKQSRKGKVFYGCNRYPDCKFASWEKPVGQPCPQCGASLLFEKSGQSGTPAHFCRTCGFTQEDPDEMEDTALTAG